MQDATGGSKAKRSWRQALGVALAVGFVATAVSYPLLVYSLLRFDGGAPQRWRLAWLLIPLGLSLVGSLRSRGPWLRRLLPSAAALLLVTLGVTLDSLQPLLLVPVVLNGTLLVSFGATLWSSRPLIERFARLQHPDLTLAEVRWCRTWTIVWTSFFAVNMLVATTLGLLDQLRAWTIYNGLLTYIVMGGFFVGEYSVRKYRFGRYNSHPLDRLLRWCFERTRRPSP
jgi:uncharacterized membrane protein